MAKSPEGAGLTAAAAAPVSGTAVGMANRRCPLACARNGARHSPSCDQGNLPIDQGPIAFARIAPTDATGVSLTLIAGDQHVGRPVLPRLTVPPNACDYTPHV